MSETPRTDFEREFASLLGRLRSHRRLSLEAFAELVGLNKPVVTSYELGTRMPPLGKANQIAVACGYIGLGELLTACSTCLNQPDDGMVCTTCGRPDQPVPEISEAEHRLYTRLRDKIRKS